MEIDKWVGSYKVRAFPWVDGKNLYFNVQYFAPGQSIEAPPALDKTVYVEDDTFGRRLVFEFTHSLAEHVAAMKILPNTTVHIKAESTPLV